MKIKRRKNKGAIYKNNCTQIHVKCNREANIDVLDTKALRSFYMYNVIFKGYGQPSALTIWLDDIKPKQIKNPQIITNEKP